GVLERHLDPIAEPSPAVRSVYGQYFEWLYRFDKDWVRNHLSLIFSPEFPELREAAWVGYLFRGRLYDDVFQLLKAEYKHAIDSLRSIEIEEQAERLAATRVAEHLMIVVGRGIVGLDDDLLQQFFSRAPASIRSHALGYVGRALNSEGIEFD